MNTRILCKILSRNSRPSQFSFVVVRGAVLATGVNCLSCHVWHRCSRLASHPRRSFSVRLKAFVSLVGINPGKLALRPGTKAAREQSFWARYLRRAAMGVTLNETNSLVHLGDPPQMLPVASSEDSALALVESLHDPELCEARPEGSLRLSTPKIIS